MLLIPGTKLGIYEVVAPLGAGGMGEVYRARDTRLSRDVALKVLPEAFACDAQRMARFDREAKVLASLNNTHIAALYGLEESNSTRALVMELVEGPMLADRITQGAMPLEEALPIAKQIAEALEYAHERGIIHRDLKPANIKLTADGQVKLLDFGLAKALEGDLGETDISTSPTISAAATRAGILLGTAGYMSPEQARGKQVDRRADIWAFGCLLYEMLTGACAFSGDTISDTLASVIRAEPDWFLLPTSVPAHVRELLRRCLQKDAKQRLQAIGEARIAIEEVIARSGEATTTSTLATQTQPLWRRALPWVFASLAITFAITFGALYWGASQPEPHPVMQFSLSLPQALAGAFSPNPGSPFALSRDGSNVVFVGSVAGKPPQLFLLPLGQRTATPLAGTENAGQPFFSPDGQWVGFFSQGKLRKVSTRGGSVTTLADAVTPHGASWTDDETIIYAPNFGSGLIKISSAGGVPQALTTPNTKEQEVSHRWPQILPGNEAVLFTIQLASTVSYDDAQIAILSLKTGKWHMVVQGGFYARYVPSGHIIYAHAGSLMAVPFDLQRLEATGSPVPVQEGVVTTAATSGGAEFDVSGSGLLAYVPGNASPPRRSLVWIDRNGRETEVLAPPGPYTSPRLSPDGRLLALTFNTPMSTPEIYVYDFMRRTLNRLTFGPGINTTPIWSPDGRKIFYRTRAAVSFRSKLSDGSGREEVLLDQIGDPSATPVDVSSDGKALLFVALNPSGKDSLQALALDGTKKVQMLLESNSGLYGAKFSPDGRWIAYTSSESGRPEIYVQTVPGTGGKWMISREGGTNVHWARNGREIFFLNGDKLMSAAVQSEPTFRAETPRLLFQASRYATGSGYDVAPDGQHFLMLKQEEASGSPAELHITLNWFDELKRRVPAGKK